MMFLNYLTVEEREIFLDLVYHVAHVDGHFAEEEQLMLMNYQAESGLHYYDPKKEGSFEEMIATFQQPLTRNAVFVEIIGLVLADGKLDPEEKKVLDDMAEAFQFPPEKVVKMIQWVKDYYRICQEGMTLINA